MTKPMNTLNELIEITRDGKEFYLHAVNAVSDPQLKIIFRNMVDAKIALITALAEQVRLEGATPSMDGTFAGGFRKLYAETRAALSSKKDATYIAQLEQSEDRLLDAFEDALKNTTDSKVRQILMQHIPKVRICHEQMRNLKMSHAA